jgi:hypothetical protein
MKSTVAGRSPEKPSLARWASRHDVLTAGIILALVIVVVFFDLLTAAGDPVLLGSDVFVQFLRVRQFGFDQIAHGNLALWSDTLYGGIPFLGQFHAAMLYPPNIVFLLLPMAKAINLSFLSHLWLIGLFTFLWCRKRKLDFVPALLPAILLMLGGTVFLHVWEGHLIDICTGAWTPLLLLCVDGLCEDGPMATGKWILVGAGAMGLSILAGHPQYVFFSSVAVGLYFLLRLRGASGRVRAIAAMAAIVIGGVALSSVQLLTGMQASAESVRGAGLSYRLAATHSFRFENFLTLLAPNVLGCANPTAPTMAPYWGQSYQSVMCIFLGVSGLALAVYGALAGDKRQRRFSAMMTGLLLLLALGSTTPLFGLLYHYVPGFNKFRGASKFTFQASLFMVMLAGIGLQTLLREARRRRSLLVGLAIAAVAVAGGAAFIRYGWGGPGGWWNSMMLAIHQTDHSHNRSPALVSEGAVALAARYASTQLFVAAGILGLAALLVLIATRWRPAVYSLATLAVLEVSAFAMSFLPIHSLQSVQLPSQVVEVLAHQGGDYRIHVAIPSMANSAMYFGGRDIWGHDPGASARYCQLVAFVEGQDPNDCAEFFPITRMHKLFDMFRLKYVLMGDGQIRPIPQVMGRVNLVGRYALMSSRDEMFKGLTSPQFDPRQTVLLESKPSIEPAGDGDLGSVRVVDSSTDWLKIEADVKSPCLLLVTDTYSKYWRARPLPGSSQAQYDVLPANYALRAVPLGAGHHVLKMEYLPTGYVYGKWISLVSVLLYGGAVGAYVVRAKRSGKRAAMALGAVAASVRSHAS